MLLTDVFGVGLSGNPVKYSKLLLVLIFIVMIYVYDFRSICSIMKGNSAGCMAKLFCFPNIFLTCLHWNVKIPLTTVRMVINKTEK